MRLPVNRFLPLAALVLLGANTAVARDRPETQAMPVTGPAADYPVVVGEPFTIGQTVWTPTDQLNYDAVGYATVGDDSLVGVTGAHKTLPLPSYVEVTSLTSGKTILVRLEKRGPMVNDVLIQLSPMAARQLGLVADIRSPVRVRRVNPPEPERAMLRGGGQAPERMQTPQGLLGVLRRKLAEQSPALPPPSTPPTMPKGPPTETAGNQPPATKPAVSKPAAPQPASAKPQVPRNPPAPGPASAPAAALKAETHSSPAPAAKPKGALVVQVAAFSVEANARKAARQLGGNVRSGGKYWRVQLGPFTNREQAAPALEKAKRAGYSDARIQSAD